MQINAQDPVKTPDINPNNLNAKNKKAIVIKNKDNLHTKT